MEEVLKLQKKIIPEYIELLEKRYTILRTIYYNQPIGRRILANTLSVGERIVRTEINFLKEQGLIDINTPGMSVTKEGEEVIDKLKDFIHEIKGLSDLENYIKDKLNLKHVIIVPGDVEEDRTVMADLGKAGANYLKRVLKENVSISLTGGATIKEVIDSFPKISSSSWKNTLVLPARGGMGRNVEIQANTLAANLANKIGGTYKLLHVPDNLSNDALNMMLNEKDIKEVIENIHSSNILIYGIGRADEMARRRGFSKEHIEELLELGAVGEAFGYYFNSKGEIVYSTPSIGLNKEDIKKIENLIAIAGGKSKAEAIIAIGINTSNSILVTDEGAARQLVELISKSKDINS